MKRNSAGAIVFAIQRHNVSNETKIKIWRTILALLPFDDQVNCRLVSKTWMNLIASLPEFRNKLCLNLGYSVLSENDPPVSVLRSRSSILEFSALKIEDGLTLEYQRFQSLNNFLARLGETVTHLDISKSLVYELFDKVQSKDIFRSIVENLYLFKVLHHFNVGNVNEWFRVVTSTSPGPVILKKMLEKIFAVSNSPISFDTVVKFLESPAMDFFQQGIFLSRHKTLFLQVINQNWQNFSINVPETITLIIQQLEEKIREADANMNFSTKVNTSCRVLTFDQKDINFNNFDQIMTHLVPNVQEININCFWTDEVDGEKLKLLTKFADKITGYQIHMFSFGELKECNLRNLRHLKVGGPDTPFSGPIVDAYLEQFPSIKSINAFASATPKSHFDFITELEIERDLSRKRRTQLSEVAAFKKLHTLTLALSPNRDGLCFFNHEPVLMPSVKKLELSVSEYHLCAKCIDTTLRSVPNLRELKFSSEIDDKYLDSIFRHLPRVEKIEIISVDTAYPFEPKKAWAEMKKLRVLILNDFETRSDQAAWEGFGRKLKKLKYFEVLENLRKDSDCYYVMPTNRTDVMKVIGHKWPALQKLKVLVYKELPQQYDSDGEEVEEKPISYRTKAVLKEGKKFVIDEYDF